MSSNQTTQSVKDESAEQGRRLLAETAARRRHQQQSRPNSNSISSSGNRSNSISSNISNNTYSNTTPPSVRANRSTAIDLTNNSPPTALPSSRTPHSNTKQLTDEQYARQLQEQLDADEELARQLQAEDNEPSIPLPRGNVRSAQLIGNNNNNVEYNTQYPPIARSITPQQAQHQQMLNMLNQLRMASGHNTRYTPSSSSSSNNNNNNNTYFHDGGLFGMRTGSGPYATVRSNDAESSGDSGFSSILGNFANALLGRPYQSASAGGGPVIRLRSTGRVIDLYNVPNDITYDELNELQSIVGHVKPPVKAATRNDLQRLPSFTYKSNNKSTPNAITATDDDNICNICFDSFNDGDQLRSLPCFHRFHKNEIDKWLLTNEKCPVCQTPVTANTGES